MCLWWLDINARLIVEFFKCTRLFIFFPFSSAQLQIKDQCHPLYLAVSFDFVATLVDANVKFRWQKTAHFWGGVRSRKFASMVDTVHQLRLMEASYCSQSSWFHWISLSPESIHLWIGVSGMNVPHESRCKCINTNLSEKILAGIWLTLPLKNMLKIMCAVVLLCYRYVTWSGVSTFDLQRRFD